jgi:hypothetical protein
MDQILQNLISDTWELWDYAHATYPKLVPTDSAPILWFGDLDRYQASPKKVITLGINPGPLAFPQANPWRLYPLLTDSNTRQAANIYKQALDEFQFDQWFRSFNALLSSFGTSYNNDRNSNTEALHLDVCPIMTSDVWSKLPTKIRQDLAQRSAPITVRLLEYLQPEFLFISLSKGNLDLIVPHLDLSVPIIKTYVITPSSGVKHQVLDLACPILANSQVVWFRKTTIRPISPAGDSLRDLSAFFSGQTAIDPRQRC